MTDSNNAETAAPAPAKRFRSEIEFPYSDLENALELANTIHTKAGSSAQPDELAAWMGQTASGGTFRTRVGAARLFGLVETGGGQIALTQLGREALSGSGNERAARITAFLKPELFAAMYDMYKGAVLPPPAAIERQMEQMGVSPKQKDRARQAFSKSATFAGFIDQVTGRFVKPGIVGPQRDEAPLPDPEASKKGGGSGGGGDEPPTLDPIIAGLLRRIPRSGSVWPDSERKLWLELLEGSFRLIFKDKQEAAN